MVDSNRNLSPCGTQIDDLPACLIMDILSRLPAPSLLSSRVVCRSWNLVFSDPLFVKLHLARSPTHLIRWSFGKPMKFYSSYCRSLAPGMSSEASASQGDDTMQGSKFTCINSSSGLLCLEKYEPHDEIYVCNPILGQYITIKTGNTKRVRFCLGFSSRSNQFKVLQISSPKNRAPYMARIYTIGDGTRQWKSIGIAPSCPFIMRGGFLNGSIHWVDLLKTGQVFYFNFDSEQFGSLPSPPLPPHRDVVGWHGTMGVLDECLFYYTGSLSCIKPRIRKMDFWIMKEYGVEESWIKIFSLGDSKTGLSSLYKELSLLYEKCKIQLGDYGTTYHPSFISLQNVAKDEQLTMIS